MKFFAFLVVALMAAFVRAEEEEAVVTLTTSNFDDFIKNNNQALVEFYAPWCGHCKKLTPEYEGAAKKLKGTFALAKVDATVERELGDRFGVRGYPTIKYFKNGKDSEYDGGRTESTIIDWVEKKTGPAVRVLSSADELTKLTGEKDVVFVAKVKSTDDALYKTFETTADDNRDAGTFAAVVSSSGDGSVSVIRKDEGETKASDVSASELTKFITEEAFPLFGPINGDNYSKYVDSGLDLVWAAMSSDDFTKSSAAVREVAKEVRKEYALVWLDTDQFGSHAESALGVSEYPALVIQKKNGRYLHPSNDFSAASIRSFFADVKSGKIQRTIKSEPIPESQEEAVKVVVANAFEDMLFNQGKDVFFEVYAPWCGHCKRLEPILTEFAEEVATTMPALVVAKMDGTANEAPVENFDWTGFPTIFYVKHDDVVAAKAKGVAYNPEKYNGGRTKEDLIEFAKKNQSESLKSTNKPAAAKEEL